MTCFLKVLKQQAQYEHTYGKNILYVYLKNKVYAYQSKQGNIQAMELWKIYAFNFILQCIIYNEYSYLYNKGERSYLQKDSSVPNSFLPGLFK